MRRQEEGHIQEALTADHRHLALHLGHHRFRVRAARAKGREAIVADV